MAFLLGYAGLYLIVMAILRAILLATNSSLAVQIDNLTLARSFLVGLRFDLVVTCIIGAPLVLALLLPRGLGNRKIALAWLAVMGSITLFAGVSEIEFYREFHVRLNSIAFHYFQEDFATVSSMIWNGYPVLRYLLLWGVLSGSYLFGLAWINRRTRHADAPQSRLPRRVVIFLVVLFLAAWGGRGTLRSGPPLRWGDAFHSQYLFANHLALNGSYTLAKAAMAQSGGRGEKSWLHALPDDQALATVRNMVLTPNDVLLAPDRFPLLRHHTPDARLPVAPRNIVVILMESFSGAFTGALSGVRGITPEFDTLAESGLLFDHFFSNGTHTHQGMFASLACFPNLPGHEYLMQQPEGQHQFSGLPSILGPMGYRDLYIYNGHFAWDNQQGFFRNQGVSRFIGRDEYVDPVFLDPTWGVSDEDMFSRAIEEIDRFDGKEPFYAILQTLSNHTPYALPAELAVEPVTGFGRLDEHLTAQRYSDWALGQFFATAKTRAWFAKTLFVIVGDHGFGLDQQLSDVDLLRFHVPLLLVGAGIQQTYGSRNHTVATQVDLVPTIVSLLGREFTHQCWGRDLLSLPAGDAGFGVVKPSGSDQTVALIRGNEIAVKPAGGDLRLGSYALYPATRYDAGGEDTERYALELASYIQVGLEALLNNRTGLAAPAPDKTAEYPAK